MSSERKRKHLIGIGLAMIAGAAILIQMGGSTSEAHGVALKLEGAWVAKVVELNGDPSYPFQWSYVLAQDPSGRSATLHGSVDVSFPGGIPQDYRSPLIGEIVLTGPRTGRFDAYWYGVSTSGPIDEIVQIGRSYGEILALAPNKFMVTHNFEIFLPEADMDGDGFPEGDPIAQFTAVSMDTRLPMPR